MTWERYVACADAEPFPSLRCKSCTVCTVEQRDHRSRSRVPYVANLTMWRSLPNFSEGWETPAKIAT